MGYALPVGDINVHTKDKQTTLVDANQTMYGADIAEEFGLKRQAQDMSKVTEFRKHFLALGNAFDSCYKLVCNNGQDQML